MMRFARWMAKNRKLAKWLFGALLVACYSLLIVLGVPLWAVIIIDLFVVFLVCAYVDGSYGWLQKKPLQALTDDCDPYPLLEETSTLMTYGITGTLEQQIIINHCVALREVGRYQDALKLLETIHIDRYSGTLPLVRFVYYNNLTDLLTLVGRYPEAEVWYQKAVQVYQDMPENKMKQNLSPIVASMAADAWFRREEYAKALECANNLYPPKPIDQIQQAMLIARCHIALSQPEEARKPLEFVIARGNRLHAVSQARAMLTNCN